MNDEKQCSKCMAFKPVEEFYKGYNQCKACVLERQRKYREANREKVLESNRKYREANREKVRESGRKHYKANRDEVRERSRKYREANPEKERERDRKGKDRKRSTTVQQAIFRAQDPDTLAKITERLAKIEQKNQK